MFSTALDPNVFVLRLVPGMRADIIPMLEGRYRALVLESFGVGGIPQQLMDAFAAGLFDKAPTEVDEEEIASFIGSAEAAADEKAEKGSQN